MEGTKKIIEKSKVYCLGVAVACFFCATSVFAQSSSFGIRSGGLQKNAGDRIDMRFKSESGGSKESGAEGQTGPGYSGGSNAMEYQVHVLGEVHSPGTYRLGPSVRLAEAISMAGGVKEGGSFRNMELRSGGTNRKVDLFRFLHKGDLSANPFLQDNDVIFVPYAERAVRIEGPIKNGGIYELVNEKNVWDIIELAGGYTSGVSQEDDVVLVRFDEKEKKKVVKVANVMSELKQTPIQNGDVIVVPHIFMKNKKFDYTISQLPGDHIFYPTSNDSIYVVGAVTGGGAYPYNAHFGVQEYVNMSGPTPLSKVRKARVMTADGHTIRNTKKYSLNPGDTIIVPERKMTVTNTLAVYGTFTSTLFSVLALRSLVNNGF